MFCSDKYRYCEYLSNQTGFTLIELVVIIVIAGILSTGAVVHYRDLSGSANNSSLKYSLETTRESINTWRMNNIVKTGSADYPDLATLSTPGEILLFDIPKNPLQSDNNAPDSIVTGVTKGTVVGTRGGWAYKPSTGEFWANTNTDIPPSCKNLAGKLNENTW